MIDISILMPVYNAEKYLVSTIDTIKKQDFNNWELIIVDDGSTDGSKEICRKLINDDKRIKYIYQGNLGVSHTRNVALKNAQGKYIAFIDSDDYVKVNYLSKLINSIKEKDSDITVCGFIERKESADRSKTDTERDFFPNEVKKINEMENLFLDFINSGTFNPLWNKLYKRSIIEKFNIRFDEAVETGEDFIFNLDYLRRVQKVSFIKEKLYYYIRRNNNSITNKYIDGMYEEGCKIHSLLEDFLRYMNFYNKENDYILYGNHLGGVFSAILNLYHSDCTLNAKEKRAYIKQIINKPYVKECAANRKRDKGIIGLTSLLVRMNNTFLICAAFKGIALIRKVKA